MDGMIKVTNNSFKLYVGLFLKKILNFPLMFTLSDLPPKNLSKNPTYITVLPAHKNEIIDQMSVQFLYFDSM